MDYKNRIARGCTSRGIALNASCVAQLFQVVARVMTVSYAPKGGATLTGLASLPVP